jgi:hypothetical protein
MLPVKGHTDSKKGFIMMPNGTALPHGDEPGETGLPRLTLEARARLGPNATPEQVTDDVRAQGYPDVTVEQVRLLWDEGHLPAP